MFANRKFELQHSFIKHPAKLKVVLCTRRSGKSYGAGLYLFQEAYYNAGVSVLYIGLTRESAKRIMWKDVLKNIDKTFGLESKFKENDLTCELPNGSMIYLLGADSTDEEREKLLGQKYKLVVIDEAAQYSINLDDLVYGVLKPAVADYRGVIALIGTPSNLRRGLYYELTQGQDPGCPGIWTSRGGSLKAEWTGFRWSANDNPFMKEQWTQEIAELRAANPFVDDTPLFQQHYLGRWVINDSKLVYKYDPTVNTVEKLPEYVHGSWHLVLGIDLGYNDPSAFSLCAYHDFDPTMYVLECDSEAKMDITAVAERIRFMKALARKTYELEIEEFIIDGANKQAVEEMRKRHGLQLTAGNKTGKTDFIELMNGEFISRRIKLVAKNCTKLAEEYSGLIWNKRSSLDDANGKGVKREEHPGCANHCADATLYAWRRCYAYLSERPAPKPKRGTPEYYDAEAKKMEEQELARLEEELARERELEDF